MKIKKLKKYTVELYPHNKKLFRKAWGIYQDKGMVAFTQATGTGKSFNAVKFIHKEVRYSNQRSIVISPSGFLREEYEKADPVIGNKALFLTYHSLKTLNIRGIGYEVPLVVLDEYHRSGASKWQKWVKRLLKKFPNAGLVGSSATDIRYHDGNRNMTDEIFEGNNVEYDLSQAILEGVLPSPKYCIGFSDITHDIGILRHKIQESADAAVKTEILQDLERVSRTWHLSKSPVHILSKHLRRGDFKGIVFCESIKEIEEAQTGSYHGNFHSVY